MLSLVEKSFGLSHTLEYKQQHRICPTLRPGCFPFLKHGLLAAWRVVGNLSSKNITAPREFSRKGGHQEPSQEYSQLLGMNSPPPSKGSMLVPNILDWGSKPI